MQLFEFTGTTVHCYTENDVRTIGIGDDDFSPTNFVIISRLDEDEDEDLHHPVDKNIGIQTNFSNFESEAAITAISLKENKLLITIKPEKIRELGAGQICISLNVNSAALRELARYLHLIFDEANLDIFIDIR